MIIMSSKLLKEVNDLEADKLIKGLNNMNSKCNALKDICKKPQDDADLKKLCEMCKISNDLNKETKDLKELVDLADSLKTDNLADTLLKTSTKVAKDNAGLGGLFGMVANTAKAAAKLANDAQKEEPKKEQPKKEQPKKEEGTGLFGLLTGNVEQPKKEAPKVETKKEAPRVVRLLTVDTQPTKPAKASSKIEPNMLKSPAKKIAEEMVKNEDKPKKNVEKKAKAKLATEASNIASKIVDKPNKNDIRVTGSALAKVTENEVKKLTNGKGQANEIAQKIVKETDQPVFTKADMSYNIKLRLVSNSSQNLLDNDLSKKQIKIKKGEVLNVTKLRVDGNNIYVKMSAGWVLWVDKNNKHYLNDKSYDDICKSCDNIVNKAFDKIDNSKKNDTDLKKDVKTVLQNEIVKEASKISSTKDEKSVKNIAKELASEISSSTSKDGHLPDKMVNQVANTLKKDIVSQVNTPENIIKPNDKQQTVLKKVDAKPVEVKQAPKPLVKPVEVKPVEVKQAPKPVVKPVEVKQAPKPVVKPVEVKPVEVKQAPKPVVKPVEVKPLEPKYVPKSVANNASSFKSGVLNPPVKYKWLGCNKSGKSGAIRTEKAINSDKLNFSIKNGAIVDVYEIANTRDGTRLKIGLKNVKGYVKGASPESGWITAINNQKSVCVEKLLK